MFGMAEKKWFEKATEQTRIGNFPARIIRQGSTPLTIVGTAISATGVTFMTRERMDARERELDLKMVLRERPLNVRVLVEKSEVVTVADQKMERHFGKFTGIAADDWDLVVRYVKGLPEPTAAQARETARDEEFRMLPTAVRAQITQKLIEARRLASPEAGKEPLIRFHSEGTSKTIDGRVKHRVAVQSRNLVEGDRQTFTSHFTIWEASGLVELHEDRSLFAR